MPERETGCCVNVSGMSAQDVSRLSSLGGSIRSLPRVPARGYACKLLWVKKDQRTLSFGGGGVRSTPH